MSETRTTEATHNWSVGDRVTVDTALDRTTEFVIDEGGFLAFSTSSTGGAEVRRVYVNDEQIDLDPGSPWMEEILDSLHDEGYDS